MRRSMLCLSLFITLGLLLSGCAPYAALPGGTVKAINGTAVLSAEQVSLAPMPENSTPFEYLIGPGDVLMIDIPDLAGRASIDQAAPPRFMVYSSGKVVLPQVGAVQLAGLSLEQAQARLTEVFAIYVKNPLPIVEIVEFRSKPLYLLGKFNSSGVQYLDRPLNLIQGIALGGGLQDSANLRGARLVRDEQIVPVDIYELLNNNDQRQNIALQPGDTIYVPGNEQQPVFVFGAVNAEGAVPMVNGRLSLLQALSISGLNKSGYDHSQIRIIRSYSPSRGELIVIDLARIMAGEAMPYALQGGDIVYVPRSGAGDWNRALGDLLPTLRTFGAVLEPFVQLKYLRQ